MSRVQYTIEQLKKLGLVQVNNGPYQSIEKLVDKKPKKLPLLNKAFLQAVPDNKVIGNAKVKNATKVEADGLKFDSRLEYYMYGLLKGAGIEFQFQKVYLLQEKFIYSSRTIRAITLTVDFWLLKFNMIIDTKGLQTQQGALRWKMLKKHLVDLEIERVINTCDSLDNFNVPRIEMPKNKRECELLLNRLLFDKL